MSKRVVVALGGNAILQRGQKGTAAEQMESVNGTAKQLVRMIESGYEVVVTHGNGPQVGAILIQNELGSSRVPAMPMDVCGAETQGFIGYMLCQNLHNLMAERGISGKEPAAIVTQVEVNPDDQAFTNPTKPVGPFFDEAQAKQRIAENGESWIEDSGRGWRRVVPSPDPVGIVERELIVRLVEAGSVVIASGGGGIPVYRDKQGALHGVEAVIDKDLAGERLAREVNADYLMILTDVPNVAVRFGQPDQESLRDVTVGEMERYAEEGHFRAGSMGPKVKAATRFMHNGGEKSIIANLGEALEALEGRAGTQIRKD
ncbi:MAG: carbamate kinase [Synergistales bacterium]|nr:carbamate kinase [Synergistales bacterium]